MGGDKFDKVKLVTHPESQEIYQEGEVEEAFLESVREKGIVEPLKVTDNSYFLPEKTGVTVSGNRRKAAAQKLGIEKVPVVPLEFSSKLQEKEAILTFNLQRDKTFSQKMREAERWKEIYRERAKENQGKRTDLEENHRTSGPNGPEVRIRKRIAGRVGISSGRQYQRAKKIWLKAKVEEDERVQELVEEIDKGENSISGAYKEIREKEKGGDSKSIGVESSDEASEKKTQKVTVGGDERSEQSVTVSVGGQKFSISEPVESEEDSSEVKFQIHLETEEAKEKASELFEKASEGNELVQKKLVRIKKGAESLDSAYRSVKREEREKKRAKKAEKAKKTLPEGKYRVIYADPPWMYDNDGLKGTASDHYFTMTPSEIQDMPVQEKAAENSVLFLWVTSPQLEEGLEVLDAWGFEYKTSFVWVKDESTYGKLGFYTYTQHEFLLVGVRGSCLPKEGSLEPSVISASKGKHSEKPEKVYEIIEQMYDGPYLELFARQEQEDWTVWGDEVASQRQK